MSEKPVNPGGRPSKYNPEFNIQAYRLALLGATDGEMSEFFDISESTLNLWKLEHQKFSESIQEGKVKADSQVAQKLYDRAMGAEWTEEQAFKVKNQSAPGVFTEDVITVPVRKAAPPDTQAISLWLRNRNPNRWKDKTEKSIDIEVDYTVTVNVSSQLIDSILQKGCIDLNAEEQRVLLTDAGDDPADKR